MSYFIFSLFKLYDKNEAKTHVLLSNLRHYYQETLYIEIFPINHKESNQWNPEQESVTMWFCEAVGAVVLSAKC